MSSHHIIREKQEPALYIHTLGQYDEESLGQLLEWSPTVIVSDHEYEKILSIGIKVDWVAKSDAALEVFQDHTGTIDVAGDNHLTAVLNYLVAEAYPAVNIVDGLGQISFQQIERYIVSLNVVILTRTGKSFAIRSGFKVWKPAGTIYQIEVLSYFETANLQQNESGYFVVLEDGFVEFLFSAPYLFITEVL